MYFQLLFYATVKKQLPQISAYRNLNAKSFCQKVAEVIL